MNMTVPQLAVHVMEKVKVYIVNEIYYKLYIIISHHIVNNLKKYINLNLIINII